MARLHRGNGNREKLKKKKTGIWEYGIALYFPVFYFPGCYSDFIQVPLGACIVITDAPKTMTLDEANQLIVEVKQGMIRAVTDEAVLRMLRDPMCSTLWTPELAEWYKLVCSMNNECCGANLDGLPVCVPEKTISCSGVGP